MRGNGCGCDGISSCPSPRFEPYLVLALRMLLASGEDGIIAKSRAVDALSCL